MYKKIIHTLFLGVILLTIILLAACTTSNDDAMVPVKYGGQYFPEEFLLKGYDFWSRYGVQIDHTLFESSSENNMALITGAIDVSIASPEKAVAVFEKLGDKAVIIAVSERGNRYSTVVKKDSGITSWEDLVGQKVGIRLGTGAEQVVRQYFDHTPDLSWDDFEWVNLRLQDMAVALNDGSIAAFTAWEPIPAAAQAADGAEIMMSYGEIAPMPVLILTTARYAKNHRAELAAFLRGHLDKLALINSNTARAAEIASQTASGYGYTYSPQVFETMFKRISFALEIDENTLSAVDDTMQFLLENKFIEAIPQYTVDASFLEEAMQNALKTE